MQAKRLIFPVGYSGRDFFGRRARIDIRPTSREGWYWQYSARKEPVLISAGLLEHGSRRLVLSQKGYSLNVYEHIGALRWIGLDGIVISSTSWPPYDGRVWELYDLIGVGIENVPSKLSWFSIKKEIRKDYPKSNGLRRYLQAIPDESQTLKLHIFCEYQQLGYDYLELKLPRDSLEDAFKAYTQGWPPSRYKIGKIARHFGWPHMEKVIWPNSGRSEKEILKLFIHHRAADLLGALSLMHPTRLFSGTVISYNAGHWADVQMIQEAQEQLRMIEEGGECYG